MTVRNFALSVYIFQAVIFR